MYSPLEHKTIRHLQNVNSKLRGYAARNPYQRKNFDVDEVSDFHRIDNDQGLGKEGTKKIDLVNSFKQLTGMAYAVSQNLLTVARGIFPKMKINEETGYIDFEG